MPCAECCSAVRMSAASVAGSGAARATSSSARRSSACSASEQHAARVVDHHRGHALVMAIVVAQRAEAGGRMQQRAVVAQVTLVEHAAVRTIVQPRNRRVLLLHAGRIGEFGQRHAEQFVGAIAEHRAPALVDEAQATLRIRLQDADEVLFDQAALQLRGIDARRLAARRRRAIRAHPRRRSAGCAWTDGLAGLHGRTPERDVPTLDPECGGGL
jgi:hypothetical protein